MDKQVTRKIQSIQKTNLWLSITVCKGEYCCRHTHQHHQNGHKQGTISSHPYQGLLLLRLAAAACTSQVIHHLHQGPELFSGPPAWEPCILEWVRHHHPIAHDITWLIQRVRREPFLSTFTLSHSTKTATQTLLPQLLQLARLVDRFPRPCFESKTKATPSVRMKQ